MHQIFLCTVITTPYYEEISNGMDESKILYGFSNGDFGYITEFNKKKSHLIT